jgi:hypothetical protein
MSKTKIPYPSSGGSYQHRDGALHRIEPGQAAEPAPRKTAPAAPSAAPKSAAAPKKAARKTPTTKR